MTGPELFRAALKERGLSQNEVERRLGVSAGTASRWSSGATAPSLKCALELEKMLGIPPASWVKDDEKPNPDAAA